MGRQGAIEALDALATAYLRSQLYPEDTAWQQAQDALAGAPKPLGRVESK